MYYQIITDLLYTELFSPCVIFALLDCKQFCSVLNSPRHSFVQREIIEDVRICPVLPTDNEGKMGKNKTGKYEKFMFRNLVFNAVLLLTEEIEVK